MSSIQQHLHSTQAGKTRDAFLGQRTMEKRTPETNILTEMDPSIKMGILTIRQPRKEIQMIDVQVIKTIYLYCKK